MKIKPSSAAIVWLLSHPNDVSNFFHNNDLFFNGDSYRSNYLTKQAREKFFVHGIIVIKKYVKQIGKKNERNY